MSKDRSLARSKFLEMGPALQRIITARLEGRTVALQWLRHVQIRRTSSLGTLGSSMAMVGGPVAVASTPVADTTALPLPAATQEWVAAAPSS